MFSKLALFALSAIALVSVSAVPTPGGGDSQCNTGPVQCCNSAQDSKNLSDQQQSLLGLLGIGIDGLIGEVGFDCTPINVVGIGSNSCSATPVCCENNNFNGLVVIGCSPISL